MTGPILGLATTSSCWTGRGRPGSGGRGRRRGWARDQRGNGEENGDALLGASPFCSVCNVVERPCATDPGSPSTRHCRLHALVGARACPAPSPDADAPDGRRAPHADAPPNRTRPANHGRRSTRACPGTSRAAPSQRPLATSLRSWSRPAAVCRGYGAAPDPTTTAAGISPPSPGAKGVARQGAGRPAGRRHVPLRAREPSPHRCAEPGARGLRAAPRCQVMARSRSTGSAPRPGPGRRCRAASPDPCALAPPWGCAPPCEAVSWATADARR